MKRKFLVRISKVYNLFVRKKVFGAHGPSDLKEFNEIEKRMAKRTNISDHLLTLFVESFGIKPRLIVELGVGAGGSNFVLERVAALCGSKFLSVDIKDYSGTSSYEGWTFVQKDDIEFAKEFENWCKSQGTKPEIDILFIDTSHLFDHTVQEIKSWFGFLSQISKVVFHDTNLRDIYFRRDGSMGIGWDNDRGVIRAVEEYFHTSFNETKDFVDFRNGWIIKHYSLCNGLTILEKCSEKIPSLSHSKK